MWYIAVIYMAQPEKPGRRRYTCESSNVLISSDNPSEAYDKANAWGKRHEEKNIFGLQFLGVTLLHEIGDEIGDGVDISGVLFTKLDVWKRRNEIVPAREELSAIYIAENMDKTLEEVISPLGKQLLLQRSEENSEPPRN